MASLNESDIPFPFPLTQFEAGVDAVSLQRWFKTIWPWCFPCSAAYVLLVFGGRRLMRAREPFRLRLPLVLWNLAMALFSTVGALRYVPPLLHTVRHQGFLRSVCEQHYTRPVTGLWSALYIFSKLVEFGDTSFIVLRKRPLIFLHWYHHVLTCIYSWYGLAHLVAPASWYGLAHLVAPASWYGLAHLVAPASTAGTGWHTWSHLPGKNCLTCIYSWYGLAYLVAPARYYGAMNFCIHSLMYSYYAVRAAGFRLPKGLSMVITLLQIVQMVAAYVLLVFGGRSLMRRREPFRLRLPLVLWNTGLAVFRRLMKRREPFRLRLPLVLWNTGLAVFSILGALRTNVTLTHIILQKGFLFSVCEPLYGPDTVTGLRAAAYSINHAYSISKVRTFPDVLKITYTISKVVEFGDTFFIVLRKQPLILLHWYHHVSVCMFNWYAYSELAGPVGYFVAMNYTVHAVMYSYFAVRAAGYRLPRTLSMAITVLQSSQMVGELTDGGRLPRTLSMAITVLQSSQMVGGLLIGGYAHLTYQSGEACHWSDFASLLCVAMYGSYLVLFLHFFVKSYVSKTPRPKKD
uniref:Elongation of very long chain fatty acids protein n=1 Tax=Branchiostoma floridae TaxID=7739 RepID=C3ZRH9_BRAFL|eukprot:XP_002588768.1 hypothetical protein BRAFLDRAFT_125629 [Branchiostoma floridae]